LAKVIVGMNISLDGFVADQNGNADRLYPDLAALRHTAYMTDAIEQTGAVLMGRRTFEMADPDSYVGNCEFQVPIFVLTHRLPGVAPKQDERLTFTFVTDGPESAVAPAKAAAKNGDKGGNAGKAVQLVGGVSIAQQLFDATLVDELHIDILPVFLGSGLRAFTSSSLERIRLEKVSVQEAGARTSLRFRVKQKSTLCAGRKECNPSARRIKSPRNGSR
jgi:dihydrofolate reductase